MTLTDVTDVPPPAESFSPSEIAFTEGKATFERLLKAHEEVRPRMLQMFSASGVAVAILTGVALGKDRPNLHIWGDIGFVAILVGLAMMAAGVVGVWSPRLTSWGFNPTDVLWNYVDTEEDRTSTNEELYRDLAVELGSFIDAAEKTWRASLRWVGLVLVGFMFTFAGFMAILGDVI